MKENYLDTPLYLGIAVALIAGIGSLFSENPLFLKAMNGGLWVFEIYGILLLLWKGTLRKSSLFIGILFFFLVLGLGVFLKIKYENTILIYIGILGIILTYGFHFNLKKEKMPLDFAKLVWVLVSYLTIGSVFIFDVSKSAMFYANITLWIAILFYLKDVSKIDQKKGIIE